MKQNSPMDPISVPAQCEYDGWRKQVVGPPRGVSSDDCGSVESMVGHDGGYPTYADFWRPTDEQLAMLQAGGFIELRQYTRQMVMHSMTVHAIEADPIAKCDESCHERDEDDCPACCSGDPMVMCDSCLSYAASDR